MVRRTRIVWAPNALQSRKAIFTYWNRHNKSKIYSKKLNLMFQEALIQVSNLDEIGKHTHLKNIRVRITSHFALIYEILADKITVLDIWDTRQNPQNFPTE